VAQEPLHFISSFTLGERQPSFPAIFESQVNERISQGLYRIILCWEDAKKGKPQIDEIVFDDIKAPTDELDVDAEELVRLLVARMDEHNATIRHAVKYAVKFLYRARGPSQAKWTYIIRDVEKQKQEENDGLPPLDLMVDPERLLVSHYAGAFSEMRQVVSEARLDHVEFRQTFAMMIGVIQEQNMKIYELATKGLEHQDAQAKINQSGWDALQEGIELKRENMAESIKLNNELTSAKIELEMLKDAMRKAGRQELFNQVAPAAAIGIGRALEGKSDFFSGLLQKAGFAMAGVQLPGGPEVGGNGAAPPGAAAGMPQVDIREICTADELANKPMVSLGRLLGASLSGPQITSLQQSVLQPPEWNAFKMAIGATADDQVMSACMMLFGSLARDDARRGHLMNLLSPFQQSLIARLIDRVGGKTKGPLSPEGLSTKPVDQAEAARVAMAEKAKLEAENARKDEELLRLRKEMEELRKGKSV